MSDNKPGFSIVRVLQLFGVAVAIPLGVLVVLRIYTAIIDPSASQAPIESALEQEMRTYKPRPPDRRLDPNDDFYRIIQDGIEGNDAYNTARNQASRGDALYEALRDFVGKDDVIASSKPHVDKVSWNFSLFGGFTGPHWSETTEWCIRLRPQPGEEKMFAYRLLRMSDLPYNELLGLTKLPHDANVSPENAMNFINLSDKTELMIPLITQWSGSSAKEVSTRLWFVAPNSNICSRKAKK